MARKQRPEGDFTVEQKVRRTDGPICEVAWIGHSIKTAKKHYLRVQETDFERTLENENPRPKNVTGSENIFPTQPKIDSDPIFDPQGAAMDRKELQQEKTKAS